MNQQIKTKAKAALRVLSIITCVGTMAVGFSGAAHADPRHDRGHDRGHGHGDWHRPYHGRGYGPGYYGPGYVQSPPVVYAPPPEPVSSGINLIVPLHIH